ncbi:HlyD family efflux transporter periplasmic adaptor subunit [Arenibacter sp. 6A1]|uniref:HlyD family secretion protein n=1 Tax=Arenibacter sp. 6A1 TaxID=2720391 RepID=UPI0014472FC5|nr:HlyD family secretion protein [Arenibacter sp. 6A1]NKI28316.1 HlyD family efflux transporter periplasmic adaptor subunit [Arenibacter sp. 6A1]
MEEQDIHFYDESSYIKRKPIWMIRWGIVLIFVFFVIVIAFASVFSFNEQINASLVLTSLEPPAHIIAKHTGRIVEIYKSPNDIVFKGDILGVLESPGNVNEITELKEQLSSKNLLNSDLGNLANQFSSELKLGHQIRPFYNSFLDAYQNLLLYQNLNNEELKTIELEQHALTNNETIQNKKDEILVLERDLEISKINYERYRILFEKEVISLQEFEKNERGYLKVKRQYNILKQELNHLQLEQSRIKISKMLFENSLIKNRDVYVSNLEFSKQELLAALMDWEDKNLLRSPISGRVSFFDVWGKYQNIQEGQVVFTIVPIGKQELVARCQVPIRNSGKIKKGQRVIIKLENYPYREWGTLDGKIKTISEVPKTGGNQEYVVYVEVNDLNTSYGKTLEFKQEMTGAAEIILAEVTLLQRVFYQFRNLWSN